MSSPFLLQVLILIPVVFEKNFAILESRFNSANFGFYGKFPVCQGCPSSPNTSISPSRYLHTHIVSRSKIVRALATRKEAERKAVLVCACPLMGAATDAVRLQWPQALPIGHTVDPSGTQRIKPMLFRYVEAMAIELGQCTGTDFNGATRCLKVPKERPTRRIDGGCVSKRGFKLPANTSQKFGLLLEKILNWHSPLLLVALHAGNGQV